MTSIDFTRRQLLQAGAAVAILPSLASTWAQGAWPTKPLRIVVPFTPGGTTDPENWIIQSARRGWEQIEGRAYPRPDALGGQTDGAALRRLGVPTARMGWPWPAEGSPEPIAEGLGGMCATYIPDLMPCLEKILYACIDTLMRPRSELGL